MSKELDNKQIAKKIFNSTCRLIKILGEYDADTGSEDFKDNCLQMLRGINDAAYGEAGF